MVELKGEQADLLRQASQALARQDARTALALIDRADAFGVTHNGVLNRSLALRLMGDFAGSLVQVDRALSLQPYDFIALLAKGALLEKLGRPKAAIEPYRNALKIAPTRDRCPPALLAQIDYASEAVRKHAEALRDHMRATVAATAAELDAAVSFSLTRYSPASSTNAKRDSSKEAISSKRKGIDRVCRCPGPKHSVFAKPAKALTSCSSAPSGLDT